jgi:hypothetical protein
VHGSAGVVGRDGPTPGVVAGRRAPADDLRNLLVEIARHSAVLSTAGTKDLLIQVDGRLLHPLAWYLRDYSRVTYDVPAQRPIVVVAPADTKPAPGNYVSQLYTLEQTAVFTPRDVGELWRWSVYRDASLETMGRQVELYVAMQVAR